MIKVLIESGSTRIGGAENFITRLVENIKNIDNKIIFDSVILYGQGGLHSLFKRNFRNVYYLSQMNRSLDEFMVINSNNYDIFHAIDSFENISNLSKLYHNKLSFIQNIFPDISESRYAPNMDWLIDDNKYYSAFITEIERNLAFLKKPGIKPNSLRVIKNGINTYFWKRSKNSSDRRYDICWIGRAEVAKGVDILLSIIKYMSDLSYFVVFNEPLMPYHQELQALSKDNNLNVSYSASISSEELLNIYNDSKIYLHTSISEGQPATLLEAMSCGCVPVVGGVGGVLECINSKNSYGRVVVNTGENRVGNFVVTIRDLLKNADMNRKSFLASDYVIDNHNIEKTARDYYDLYCEIYESKCERLKVV